MNPKGVLLYLKWSTWVNICRTEGGHFSDPLSRLAFIDIMLDQAASSMQLTPSKLYCRKCETSQVYIAEISQHGARWSITLEQKGGGENPQNMNLKWKTKTKWHFRWKWKKRVSFWKVSLKLNSSFQCSIFPPGKSKYCFETEFFLQQMFLLQNILMENIIDTCIHSTPLCTARVVQRGLRVNKNQA